MEIMAFCAFSTLVVLLFFIITLVASTLWQTIILILLLLLFYIFALKSFLKSIKKVNLEPDNVTIIKKKKVDNTTKSIDTYLSKLCTYAEKYFKDISIQYEYNNNITQTGTPVEMKMFLVYHNETSKRFEKLCPIIIFDGNEITEDSEPWIDMLDKMKNRIDTAAADLGKHD